MVKYLVHNPDAVTAKEVKPGIGEFVIQPNTTIEVASKELAESLAVDSGGHLKWVVVEDGVVLKPDLNASFAEAVEVSNKKKAELEAKRLKDEHEKAVKAAEDELKAKVAAAEAVAKEVADKVAELKKTKVEVTPTPVVTPGK
jgi:hypothetical protein